MISSVLVKPLVRPLVGGRRTGTRLARSARSGTALLFSALVALGGVSAETAPLRPVEVTQAERTVPFVAAVATDIQAEVLGLDAKIPLEATVGFIPARLVAVLPRRISVRRIEAEIPGTSESKAASLLRRSLDQTDGGERNLAAARRHDRRTRAASLTFSLFGSGVHRSALPV